jgi:hypothetical protein
MGLEPNCRNKPDIYGYEMKKESRKITFGDFSASEYLFSQKKMTIDTFNGWINNRIMVSRKNFIHYFGRSNQHKNNRYSWSGRCVPTYRKWNEFGQIMEFNDNNDLCIYYLHDKDKRISKSDLPSFLMTDKKLLIVVWKKEKLEHHIDNKFNNKGFFVCKKLDDTYERICFGKTFNFTYFVENIIKKNIIFDSGMYVGNTINYSQFRSPSNFWNLLIIEEY